MFYRIFFSPQVKQWPSFTCKQGTYELLQELPNDLGLLILENYEITGNCLHSIE